MYDNLYSLDKARNDRGLHDHVPSLFMPFTYGSLRLYEKLQYLPHDIGTADAFIAEASNIVDRDIAQSPLWSYISGPKTSEMLLLIEDLTRSRASILEIDVNDDHTDQCHELGLNRIFEVSAGQRYITRIRRTICIDHQRKD
jgi:hypothetical protein